jgi:adenosylcobinamide kinase/adenosylcobinamide-phosphate guanylyltransferase
MRVALLGTGSADGWPNAFCGCHSCEAERRSGRSRQPSAALVDDVVLVDCGPTAPHAIGRVGGTLQAVEHVLLTHGHPDHLDPAFLLSRVAGGGPAGWGRPVPLPCAATVGPGCRCDSTMGLRLSSSFRDRGVRGARRGGRPRVGMVTRSPQRPLFEVTAPDGSRLLYATDGPRRRSGHRDDAL